MFLDAENTLKEHINDHIFYLEEPTGAGKSNTALNLSFQIIKKVKNINKIFYIYPFNTLVDQNIEIWGKYLEIRRYYEPDCCGKFTGTYERRERRV